MERQEYYEGDVLRFFDGKPWELSLYEAFFHRLDRLLPEVSVKVQRTQISFYSPRLFAAVSLPVRRRKGWPEHCILVTFGLPSRLDHPRIAAAAEPWPGRWTHHVAVARPGEVDEQLMDWVCAACAFARSKGEGRRRPRGC